MYTPPHNRQDDPDEILAFMREFPFATLVTHGEGGIVATHIPLTVTREAGSFRVSGHIAKANEQSAHLTGGGESMAIFAAPHSYVSPRNYEAGTSVPTWNYVAVHAYGVPVIADGRDAKLAILAEAIAVHDPSFQESFASYPAEFIDAKLKGIVAFEFAVTRVHARWKLSQDRKPAERERVALAMRLPSNPPANRLADYMDRWENGRRQN